MLISMTEGLRRRGIESFCILIKDGWLREVLEAGGTPVQIIPVNHALDLKWLSQAARLVEDRAVDVIHSHEFAMNVHGSLLARMTGRRSVATVHGRNYYGDRARRRFAYRRVGQLARMVAVSEDIRRHLQVNVGVPKTRVDVISNGIDTERFRFDPDLRTETRRQLGYFEHPVIGAIGNLYPVKGHQVLLRAVATLLEKYPDAKVFIAGRGSEEPNLKGQAKALGIDHAVSFLGFREDVHALLCAMDVFVLPSLSEGHPLSILEAMACQRPVVASAVGGVPEVIENGKQGLLFPVADHDGLSEGIGKLLQVSEWASELAEAGRRRVVEKYSLDAMLDAYLGLYGAKESPSAALGENS